MGTSVRSQVNQSRPQHRDWLCGKRSQSEFPGGIRGPVFLGDNRNISVVIILNKLPLLCRNTAQSAVHALPCSCFHPQDPQNSETTQIFFEWGFKYIIAYLLQISALHHVQSVKAMKWNELLDHVRRSKEIKVATLK